MDHLISLQEKWQNRLGHFIPIHPIGSKAMSEETYLHQLLIAQKTEIDALQYQVNRSISNNPHFCHSTKHPLISDSLLSYGDHSSRVSEVYNSENSFPQSIQTENISMLDSGEPSSLYGTDRATSSNLHYNILGLATREACSFIERGKENTEDDMFTSIQEPIKSAEGMFSENTRKELRNALGNQGMQRFLMKIAAELQQQNRGPTTQHVKEIETDIFSKYEIQSDRMSRSPENSEITLLDLKQPFRRFQENKTPSSHGIPSPIMRNLQKLKEGAKEMDMLARNYSQVTVSSGARNTFSSDEIYKLAYETKSKHHDQKYYSHHEPWPPHHPWHGRQEYLGPSGGISRSIPPSFNRSYNGQNVSTQYSDPLPHQSPLHQPQTHESSFSNDVPFGSPCNPSSSFNSRPPKCRYVSAQLSTQSAPGFNIQPYNPPSESSSGATSTSSSYSYYSDSYPASTDDDLFDYSIPFYQQSPVHNAGVIQQSQPHPPTSSRRNIFQPGVSETKVKAHPLASFDQQIQYPCPIDVMPAEILDQQIAQTLSNLELSPEVESDHSFHGYLQSGMEQLNLLKDEYTHLNQRFSSYEVNDLLDLNSSYGRSLNLFERENTAESGGTYFNKTTNDNAGGVTQRLNDLDINLNQLKHLRVYHSNRDEASDSASLQVSSTGIRCCPECKSSNKAYMNWCTVCGELLMGIEPIFLTDTIRHDSSEKRDMNLENISKEKNFMPSDEMQEVEPKRTKEEVDNETLKYEEEVDNESLKYEEEVDNESLKYDSSLSAFYYPIEHDLVVQVDLREPKYSLRQYSDILNKEDVQPAVEKDIWYREECPLVADINQQYDSRHIDASYNAETDSLDEVKDIILRNIISCKMQLAQKANQKVDHQFEKTDMLSALGDECIANSGTAKSLMSGTDQDNKVEGFLESNIARHQPAHITSPAKISLENVEMDSRVFLSHSKYQTNNLEGGGRSTEQEFDSENKELLIEIYETKKKQIAGEALMDIQIFGYDETCKSSSPAASRVIVPALNLVCSSDEEEEGNEAVEEETVDNSGKMTMCIASQTNLLKMCPSTEDCQNKICKSQNKQSKKRINPAHPKPCLGQSEVPLHRRSQANANCCVQDQRHWVKSSIAWSSYKPRELNTRSSLTKLCFRNEPQKVSSKPVLAPISRQSGNQFEAARDLDIPRAKVSHRPTSADGRHRQAAPVSSQRPSSANIPSRSNRLHVHPPAEPRTSGFTPRFILKRGSVETHGVEKDTTIEIKPSPAPLTTQNFQDGSSTVARPVETALWPGSSNGRELDNQSDSPRLLCARFHRLPHEETYIDHLHVVAKNGYEKFQEMTPRIVAGVYSLWQCLPDEIWIFIFNFLSHVDLRNLMLASRYFHRLANDETLWKYITVKPRYAMTDASLAAIAHHHPLSLAMVKCQGHSLSLDGLNYFFKETQGRLQELNICGCSQGSLVGSVVMTTAALYCQQLTHIDASYCQLNDEAFMAISNSAIRLESVCVNGFQSLKDASLLTLLKKHGKSLQTLELYACFCLTAFAFHSIGEFCTNLRRLCLGSCNKLTDSAMINLSMYLDKIQELDLRGCKNLWNDCIRKIVRNCPCIHTLVLANCHQISDTAVIEIATYLKPTLRVLDVCGCNRITDNGVFSLAKNCNQLTILDISSTRCTNSSIQQLASSKCNQLLETVRLSFLSGLTEACLLAFIHQCPKLKSIHVFGCSTLKNLAKLRTANPKLSVEGDTDESRVS